MGSGGLSLPKLALIVRDRVEFEGAQKDPYPAIESRKLHLLCLD
jgi:hypothetical protein